MATNSGIDTRDVNMLSRESQRWLEDILPIGKTISPAALRNAEGIDILRKFNEDATGLNETCLDAVRHLGDEYDRLNNGLEAKLQMMFGEKGVASLQKESAIPELKWLLDIAIVTDCTNTDPENIRSRLVQLEQEIEEKQKALEKMKDDCNRFRQVESNFGDTKYVVERALKKIEISAEADKTKLTETMNSLNVLPRKRKQYHSESQKIEKELLQRGFRTSYTSAALREQQTRIAKLEERAAALENALRRYCGLPTDKAEARRQLDDLSHELRKIDTALLEELKDQ